MHYKKALKHRYSDALTEAGALYNSIVGQPPDPDSLRGANGAK